jgi:hypothetical protein
MSDQVTTKAEQAQVLQELITKIAPLDDEAKKNVIKTLITFFEIDLPTSSYAAKATSPVVSRNVVFSNDSDISPKEFISDKSPKSDIEKVVCIAYYLTHYRSTPHFKTLDISKLNTEAAQLKFSNPAYAVENASKRGFLVPAGKGGMKQISSFGEKFVSSLPDREQAKSVLDNLKPRRSAKKGSKKPVEQDEE